MSIDHKIAMTDKQWRRLVKFANEEADWCPLCDCHPSSRHAKDCPLPDPSLPLRAARSTREVP